MLTIADLIACGVQPTQARTYADPLRLAAQRFDITTRARLAALIGQLRVESANFTATEEGLYYRTPEQVRKMFSGSVPTLDVAARLIRNPQALANHVYGPNSPKGIELGNTEVGDGWKYRGRGLIQLTGKANYLRASAEMGIDYLAQPELAAEPFGACLTACWFWDTRNLNDLADASLIDKITRAINGRAMAHADLRRQYTEQAFAALH